MVKILWGLAVVFGVLLAALGLLWALQGADLVHIEPVACVADCQPLEGFSLTWLVAGIAAMAGGATIAWLSIKKLARKARSAGPEA